MHGSGHDDERSPPRHEVAVLALPDTTAYEVGLPHQFSGSTTDAHGGRLHRVRVASLDGGPVRTSAGNAAGIDLLLHVIRRDHGSEVAGRVARRSVVAPWRDGGQPQGPVGHPPAGVQQRVALARRLLESTRCDRGLLPRGTTTR